MTAARENAPREDAPALVLRGLTKTFGGFPALRGVDLEIRKREFFTIVGPSGSGKSTLLRLLTGMEQPSAGEMILNGEVINDIPANRRPTCMVFQSLALFPHKSVGENIEFPLRIKGTPAAARRRRALDLLALLRLPSHYYEKSVTACSGGERQRVALARALAFDPLILFFDEPLSAIDYRLRKTLQKELKQLHRRTDKIFVYVTHSLEEAMVMSDRIGIMRAGQLEQVGTPDEIYDFPQNKFVAEFMGEVNLIAVRACGGGRVAAADCGGALLCAPAGAEASEKDMHLLIRPEKLRFVGDGEADTVLEGAIVGEYSLGSRIQYSVKAGNFVFVIEAPRTTRGLAAGRQVRFGWNRADSRLLEE